MSYRASIVNTQRAARIVASISVALALIAAAFLAFAPCSIRGERAMSSVGSDPAAPSITRTETICSSLIESQGASVTVFLAVPVLLAAGGYTAARMRSRTLLWVNTAILLLLSVLTGFSVGIFFLPSAGALMAAAALSTAARGSPESAEG